jgi:hypothetical protein
MSRPRKFRRIRFQPSSRFFKPAGIPIRNLQERILTLTETEAIRLIDLEELEQEKAAKKMKVSQPTLSRLLKSARKKLADSIINSKSIKIQGGRFKMMGKGRRGGGRFMAGRGGRGRMGGNKAGAGPGGACVCPKCGKEVPQIRGQPCNKRKCPKCGNLMTRK